VHPNTLARTWVREHQVLVNHDPSVSSNHLSELNEQELVMKVNEALESMTSQRGQGPKEVREKTSLVIVEYVPISHNPDTLAENLKIECDSGTEESTLLGTRCIKPLHRHTQGQWTTHLIVRCSTNAVVSTRGFWGVF